MSSKINAQEKRGTARRDTMARKEGERIVVRDEGAVTSMQYLGSNPQTRYLPREQSVWGQIREAFKMG